MQDKARNAVTGTIYQGVNQQVLKAGEWATFRQWVTAGRVVRKGEHGTRVVKVVEIPDTKREGATKAAVRRYTVFERAQTEALANNSSSHE